jgi:hypothetical protein
MALTEEDKQWIGAQLQTVRLEIERVETNLLTAFHNWASPMEIRQRSHSAALRALDLEIEAINDREQKLEPPAA